MAYPLLITLCVLPFEAVLGLSNYLQDDEPKPVKVYEHEGGKILRTQYLPRENDETTLGCDLVVNEDEHESRNETYKIRNGKMYKVTYVRKKRRKCPENSSEKLRRSATIERSAFGDSIGRSWQFWTSSNPITAHTTQKKERIKKLLNLFTIVKFDNGGCIIDNLKGTCYHQQECNERGGRSLGPCARGFGVCCYIERSCGSETRENCTYFVNEGFPEESRSASGICSLSVLKAHPEVKQFRIEFQTFELRGPVNGTCLQDRFLITGQNRNSIVPDICGYNTGGHVYVDVDAVNGPLIFNVVTMGNEVGRKFRLKITQLRNGDELLAPQNCLQYYTDTKGTIQSFNYQHTTSGNLAQAVPGYFNNLNYVICIKKGSSFCSVTYSNMDSANNETPFQLINYNTDGTLIVPRGQAGAEVFNCPDDYIVINGVRLCGDRMNDATAELDYEKSYPVTDTNTGPIFFTVRTNEKDVARGFYLQYTQNSCAN